MPIPDYYGIASQGERYNCQRYPLHRPQGASGKKRFRQLAGFHVAQREAANGAADTDG